MKKLNKLVISLLAISVSLGLTSCNTNKGPCNHIDADYNGTCDICGESVPVTKQDFQGITFNNQTVTYDGNEHSIYVEGAPSFATVSYTGNGVIEVGQHLVQATITALGYNTKVLSAFLTIEALTFAGITFTSQTFTYDGNPHSIEVVGLPSFASVSYKNNNKTSIGTYKVEAIITAPNYNTLTLSANLVIKGKNFEGITFIDQEFPYDGNYHSIYVEGAPSFASVKYENNNKNARGTYRVKATITATGYETLVLYANMVISKKLPNPTLLDRVLIYTGKNQQITYKLPNDLPRYTEVSYKVDGKVVEESNFVIQTLGEHQVSITLTNSSYDYDPTTVNAKVTVINDNIGGTDSAITPFTIDENLKYQELRSKILEGNFTIKQEYFDDFYYPNGTSKSVLSYTKMIYANYDEVFEFTYYDQPVVTTLYNTTYRHTKLQNGVVKSVYFEDGVMEETVWESSYQFDEVYYEENVIARLGLASIAWLKESSDGGFANSEEGGYVTNFGSFNINSKDNCFIEDVVAHYYRTEYNHDEHSRYTIYNIGNTTLNVPSAYDALSFEEDFSSPNSIYINGFSFDIYDSSVAMDVIMDAISVAYLPKGTYIVPTYINNLPVTAIYDNYYGPRYNNDCSGYTFKVYFDSYGYYQGEFESLGRLRNASDIYELISDGAEVLFYDDWNL